MSVFKHHDHKDADGGQADAPSSTADNAEREEEIDGTENPIARERDEALAREINSETPLRPPGI